MKDRFWRRPAIWSLFSAIIFGTTGVFVRYIHDQHWLIALSEAIILFGVLVSLSILIIYYVLEIRRLEFSLNRRLNEELDKSPLRHETASGGLYQISEDLKLAKSVYNTVFPNRIPNLKSSTSHSSYEKVYRKYRSKLLECVVLEKLELHELVAQDNIENAKNFMENILRRLNRMNIFGTPASKSNFYMPYELDIEMKELELINFTIIYFSNPPNIDEAEVWWGGGKGVDKGQYRYYKSEDPIIVSDFHRRFDSFRICAKEVQWINSKN